VDARHDVNGQEQATGPLRGVKVLELTTVIMRPLATQILGDLGADVISIENPSGNTNRSMGAGSHPWQ
jgi:crotonobetainyl-CoA:carnitine CoA-transferase CaiB-like acyl-CoA transferase